MYTLNNVARMRKREPPASHKQRFYKLPQISWSWEATSIVYWGDFSSTKETVYIFITRIPSKFSWNSVLFEHTRLFCFCLIPCNSLTCGCERPVIRILSGHHMSSTWRACYIQFFTYKPIIHFYIYTLNLFTDVNTNTIKKIWSK